ncbi:hypothetical protein [Bradyrhizobium sp. DASA03120]|uniref:hypothetical protein n=1 Tax=Bradyrhizobium sp. SMVTL-02 TaxID=3395917 RepID=UPI003F701075
MTGKKHLAIAEADVQRVFNNACMARLAKYLSPDMNPALLAEGVRQAASIYTREVRLHTVGEVRDKIKALYQAAERRQYDRVAVLRAQLSPETLRYLEARLSRTGPRAAGLRLPTEQELRDPKRREYACKMIERLCRVGGCYIQGRTRPSGRRSVTWQPHLRGPAQSRYHVPELTEANADDPLPEFTEANALDAGGVTDVLDPAARSAKRELERRFVMNLQLAWLEATGEKPTATVSPSDPDRPFANFVHECLRLVGASHADAVGLINDLSRQRKILSQSNS